MRRLQPLGVWVLLLLSAGCEPGSVISSGMYAAKATTTISSSKSIGPTATPGPTTTFTPLPTPTATPYVSPITVIGRYVVPDASDANHLRLGFSGVALGINFRGTSVAAVMQDTNNDGYLAANRHNYFDVAIDGNIINTFAIQQDVNNYVLASNLSEGNHTLWLTKRTEAGLAGDTDFWSFQLADNGNFLAAPAHPPRRIMTMGASNETGWGTDSNFIAPADCSSDVGTDLIWQNHDDTWTQMTANAVGAEVHNISWAGCSLQNIGDYWGCQDFPWLFTLADPMNANALWDANRWVPDVMILNIGPEDYESSAIGSQFEPLYVTFLQHLLTAYPKAHVYLMVGSLYTGAEHAAILAHDQNVIATMATQGYDQINILNLPEYTGTAFGCWGHTDKALHYAEAQEIIARLQEDLDW